MVVILAPFLHEKPIRLSMTILGRVASAVKRNNTMMYS
jgi:hypothetical protein